LTHFAANVLAEHFDEIVVLVIVEEGLDLADGLDGVVVCTQVDHMAPLAATIFIAYSKELDDCRKFEVHQADRSPRAVESVMHEVDVLRLVLFVEAVNEVVQPCPVFVIHGFVGMDHVGVALAVY
jgi:hypothetical protein